MYGPTCVLLGQGLFKGLRLLNTSDAITSVLKNAFAHDFCWDAACTPLVLKSCRSHTMQRYLPQQGLLPPQYYCKGSCILPLMLLFVSCRHPPKVCPKRLLQNVLKTTVKRTKRPITSDPSRVSRIVLLLPTRPPRKKCAESAVSRTFRSEHRNIHMQTVRSHSPRCYHVLAVSL